MDRLNSSLREVAFAPLGGMPSPRSWISTSLLLGCYLLGVLHWTLFFNQGDFELAFHDWPKEARVYATLQTAIRESTIPTHTSTSTITGDRFLANPEVNLSPQIILLTWFDASTFLYLDALLLYSIGYLGLVLLARQNRMGFWTFLLLFSLFMFNGHLTAHLAVGHSMWMGYFLLPYFVLLVVQLVLNEQAPWSGWLGFLLFAILIQGAFHIYFWCVGFLLLILVRERKHLYTLGASLGWSIALGLWRFVPAAFQFSFYSKPFISGYPTTTSLFQSLLQLIRPAQAVDNPVGPLYWWELDLFIGAAGAVLLTLGCILIWRRSQAHERERRKLLIIAFPMLIMLLLAIGPTFWPLAQLPLLEAERVSSRFILLPFVFLGFFVAQAYQTWFEQLKLSILETLLAFLPLGLLGIDLLQHSRAWRIAATSQAFQPSLVDLTVRIVNHPDSPYLEVLSISALASGVALLAWLAVVVRRYLIPAIFKSNS